MGQKTQQDPFFFKFLTKKSLLSCLYFVKKRQFSRKLTALMPIFCQKNVHSLKNTVLPCHFFQIFMKNPFLSCPFLVKKMSILSKLHYILGPKSQQGISFFKVFTIKLLLSCSYFVKSVHSLKNTLLSCPYFVKKGPFSQKHSVLMSLFRIFYEKPLL